MKSLLVILLCVAALSVLLLPGCPTTSAPQRVQRRPGDLAVYITGAIAGNIEPCDCPGQPRGGFSRRSTALAGLRARLGPGVLVDVGHLFARVPDPVEDRYTAAAFARMRYDAIAVSDAELDRGPDEFMKLATENKLPLVCANVTRDNAPIAPASRRVTRDNRAVVVVGVLGPRTLLLSSPRVRQQITVSDPVAAVRQALADDARAHGPADVTVVLAVLDVTERDAVVRALPPVDLVVLSTSQDRPVEFEQVGGRRVLFAPPGGRQIAAVVVGRAGPARVNAAPVDPTLPRDAALWDLYKAYSFDSNQRTLSLVGLAGGVPIVTSRHCGQCHAAQFNNWKRQRHSQAWGTLVRAGRAEDPTCQRCHSTGFGLPGGFRTADESAALVGVGCQSCHQVDPRVHPDKAKPAPQLAKVDQMVCRSCHTAATDPQFDYEEDVLKVKCPHSRPVATQRE